jgi:hypothetical protein
MPPLSIFVSYSSDEETFCKDLDRHLSLLKREGVVETWTFRAIEAGTDWKQKIDDQLERADIIVLLVSASFMASDYCWNVEMSRALQRNREGSARVLPILVRDCDWGSAPFAAIQMLPPEARAVTSWRPKDKAWAAVAESIRRVAARVTRNTATETASAASETLSQRAHRLAAESAARQARAERIQRDGNSAFRDEIESAFQSLDAMAAEIREGTGMKLESGFRRDHCLVRLKPLRSGIYPLTLHLYPYWEGEAEKSHVNVRLLFGGMVLPQESGIAYPYKPKERWAKSFPFRLATDGRWGWEDDDGCFVTSPSLAERLLNQLLQLHDDIETGAVKQPEVEW